MTTYSPAPTYSDGAIREPRVSGWNGWTVFAAVMLAMAGAFGMMAGLVALFRDQVFLVVKDDLIVSADYTTWGWIHLALGGLLVLAAISLIRGYTFGRVVAVLCACLSALANLAFLPAHPVWSTLIIAVDVLVIYAVTVHAGELRQLSD